jgi:hypothetical protein
MAALFAAAPIAEASAQSFLERLFGAPRYRTYAPEPPASNFDPFGMFRENEDRRPARTHGPGAYTAYCVRTCDGKYFPVNRGGRGDISPESVCNAMCPAAKTKIFSGTEIERAVANDGQLYSQMPNALAYRTKVVDNCSCNGRDPFGVVTVDLENDPTLRTGDIVVRNDGLHVFRGVRAPYKSADFTPINRAQNLNPALRKQLSTVRVLPNNPHAPFAMTVTIRQTPEGQPEVVVPERIVGPNGTKPLAENRPAAAADAALRNSVR